MSKNRKIVESLGLRVIKRDINLPKQKIYLPPVAKREVEIMEKANIPDFMRIKESTKEERAINQVVSPVLELKGKKGKKIFDTILNSKPGNYNAKKASKKARKYLREQGYYM